MSLKNNIIKVFSANILTAISGVIISFIVPMVLSVEGYAELKTYTFYVSYILIVSLGFVDGINYKYGGKKQDEIDLELVKFEHRFFLFTQIIFTIIFIILGIYLQSIMIIMIGISIIPINLSWFYKFYYQATGEFRKYTNISYIYTITYFISNCILIFLFKSDNYIYYCFTTIISHGLAFAISEIIFYKKMKIYKVKYSNEIFFNIKVGIVVLIGNLSTMLFYALDRWFIKIFLTTNDFAYYSFSISMMNLINILVSSLSITFYNYLARGKSNEDIKKIKIYLIILGAFCSSAYFIFAGIITIMLKKYIPSLSIIAISFAAYPYIITINALIVNLYKANKKEKKYVRSVFIMVIVSLVYNIIAIILAKKSQSIAIATTLAFITWYIISMMDFKYLSINIKEVLFLGIVTISFLFLSHNIKWFIGIILYLSIVFLSAILIYKNELTEVLKKIIKYNSYNDN
ncbi:hypothetical protein ABFP60_17790 [Clostridioides difficile]